MGSETKAITTWK